MFSTLIRALTVSLILSTVLAGMFMVCAVIFIAQSDPIAECYYSHGGGIAALVEC